MPLTERPTVLCCFFCTVPARSCVFVSDRPSDEKWARSLGQSRHQRFCTAIICQYYSPSTTHSVHSCRESSSFSGDGESVATIWSYRESHFLYYTLFGKSVAATAESTRFKLFQYPERKKSSDVQTTCVELGEGSLRRRKTQMDRAAVNRIENNKQTTRQLCTCLSDAIVLWASVFHSSSPPTCQS